MKSTSGLVEERGWTLGKEIKVRGVWEKSTKGIMVTRKQNLNKFCTWEDFLVQKNIYMPGEIPNDSDSTGFVTPSATPPACHTYLQPQQPRRTFKPRVVRFSGISHVYWRKKTGLTFKFSLKKYQHLLTHSLTLAEDQFSMVTFPSYYNKFGAVTFTSAYLKWS